MESTSNLAQVIDRNESQLHTHQGLKICARCVLDEGVPEIAFDANGECNYCKVHDALSRDFPNDSRGKPIFDRMIETMRQAGRGRRYDCVVGVSGGTDSTYLTHLAKEVGLRPLAVHLDGGWDSQIAVSNIKHSLELLKVDLHTHVVNWEEIKDLYRSALRASIPWPDGVTDVAIVASLYRAAALHGIKYIWVGNNFRTEGRQPDAWTDFDGRILQGIHRRFGTVKLNTFPNLTAWTVLRHGLLGGIKMFRPFYFIPYVKSDAKKLLTERYGWRDYGGHHHESIFTRYIIGVWLPRKFGIDKRKVTYSALVRSGEISRADALHHLAEPAYAPEQMARDEEYIIKKLGFTREEFDQILRAPNHSHRDFPNYSDWHDRLSALAEFVVRRILPWKPMMFYRPRHFAQTASSASPIASPQSSATSSVTSPPPSR